MDIFKQAKEFPDADYYDPYTGKVYLIKEYTELKKKGVNPGGIRVFYDGLYIGYVKEEKD